MSLSAIMRRAWQLYKQAGCRYRAEFAEALRAAWAEAKAFDAKLRGIFRRVVLYIKDGNLAALNPDGATDEEARWVRRNREAITARLARATIMPSGRMAG
ncbi:MAG: hypothetical protein FWC55_00005, partial [Firmicutes bacterium]|nr:hypothetical protein [Bacillota bacterium]